MKPEVFFYKGRQYKHVGRMTAKDIFQKDFVYIYPCNLEPFESNGCWITASPEASFETAVTLFEMFNCNAETGRNAAFGVKM